MAGYCTIRGDQLWYDRAVEGLSDTAHRLLMYCFHGPGRTALGVRRFTLQDVLARVPSWTSETAQAALDELLESGLVEYDPDTRLLFVAPYFDHSPIKGVSSIQGAAKVLEDLPDSPVLAKPLEHLLEAARLELSKGARDRVREELTRLARDFVTRLARVNEISSRPGEEESPVEPPLEGGGSCAIYPWHPPWRGGERPRKLFTPPRGGGIRPLITTLPPPPRGGRGGPGGGVKGGVASRAPATGTRSGTRSGSGT